MKNKNTFIKLMLCILALSGRLAAQEQDSVLAALSLNELLVLKISTAAKYEQSISEAPASVTIITAEEIAAYGYEKFEDVFKSIRGFYMSNDRNYGYVGARGFSRPTDYNNRILILINGHTVNDNIYDAAQIGTEFALDLEAIERIEIVRGPGSALYGASALFAVVNIMTKPGKTIDGLTLGGAIGSYGQRRAAALVGKELENGVDFMASALWAKSEGQDLYYKEYDAAETNHGRAENSDREEYYGLLATMKYKNFQIHGDFSSRQKMIPTGAYGVVFNNPAAKTLDAPGFIEIKQAQRFGSDKNLVMRGYYDQYKYAGTYPYEDGNSHDMSIGRWLGSEAQFGWDPRPNNRLTFGLEYRKHLRADYRVKYVKSPALYGDFPYAVVSVYFQEENQITSDLAFTLGVRRDWHSRTGNVITPRAALVYHPFRASSFKFLYGEAFRAPSVWEAEGSGIDDQINKPNRELEAEKISTSELVWEQRLGAALFATVSGYHYSLNNLIDTVRDPVDGLVQYQNRSRAKTSGFEVELTGRLQARVRGFLNYSRQNARDSKSNRVLTNSPRHLAKAGLIVTMFKKIQMAAELQYETGRKTVYDTKTQAYLLANLQLSTKAAAPSREGSKKLLGPLDAKISVNNLFDVTYQTPGGVEHLSGRARPYKQNNRIWHH
ncbi:MAG: TonB-dependent receptor, partial [candidate division KSB1 bacterium]